MCGINGIYAYHYAANPIDQAELLRSRDSMASRGPDGSGVFVSQERRVGFGHRRLSIIDLTESGAQPMTSSDGRYTITYNGELYNWREIRRRLEASGIEFRSHCDTEVLLNLFAERGIDMLAELEGMFAFAIWDDFERKLFLARDPYGIKPLYWSDDGWTYRFASQVKALVAGGNVSTEPDSAGWTGFYLFGSVPEPFTTFAAIRALPAGCWMVIDEIGPRDHVRYHSIAEVYREAEVAIKRPADAFGDLKEVRQALLSSVRRHLVSDVPVGAFLSAGVDSGALVGLMRDAAAREIETVTIAFEEFAGTHEDEAPLAEMVAQHYETKHVTRTVTRSEFETDLPLIFAAMDQPSIDGINAWFVSKAARERGLKVAISGLGGDELFGGYPSFNDIPRWVGQFALPGRVPMLGKLARTTIAPVLQKFGMNPKAAGMLEFGGTYAGAYLLKRGLYMPWELPQVLDSEMIDSGLRRLQPMRLMEGCLGRAVASPFAKVAVLESSLYMRNQLLRDTDWASMAHSLEVRVPLVDRQLLNELAPIVSGLTARHATESTGKSVLAGASSRALPSEIVERSKTGFVTPVARWMRSLVDDTRTYRKGAPWARVWSDYVRHQLMPGA